MLVQGSDGPVGDLQEPILSGLPISSSLAKKVLRYVADNSVGENVWQAMLMGESPPILSPSTVFLSRLRLVNSTWNKLITPILYESIHLSTAKQASSLLETLDTFPERGFQITSFTLTLPNAINHEAHPKRRTLRNLFKKRIPLLKHLYLYTTSFCDSMIYLKDCLRGYVRLVTLYIRCRGPTITMNKGFIWSILLEFPVLEELWFEFKSDDNDNMTKGRGMPFDLYLPRMIRLGISGAGVEDEEVERLCCVCPNLQEMQIDKQNRFWVLKVTEN